MSHTLIILSIMIWWFAIVDTKGEVQYFDRETKAQCMDARYSWARVIPRERITDCIPSPNERDKQPANKQTDKQNGM